MARQTDGISQYLSSASSINLSGVAVITLAFWLWWNAFANDDALALEFGVGSSAGGITIDPNSSAGSFQIFTYDAAGANLANATFTRPSPAVWHQYVINLDRTKSTDDVFEVYVDGANPGITHPGSGDPTGNFGNLTLGGMSRTGSTLFGAGRLAEVAIWNGNLSGADVAALYNGGLGALANTVQSGSLAHYWRLLGAASPEPATVGGIDMTVNGATAAAHPFSQDPIPSVGELQIIGVAGTRVHGTILAPYTP